METKPMTNKSGMTPLRSLRDLADASPGAAASDALFKQPAPLTSEQKAAIDRDLARIEAFRTGKLEPELPTHPVARAVVLAGRKARGEV